MEKTEIIAGQIFDNWANEGLIEIRGMGEPFSMWAVENLTGKFVTCRYWINDTELSKSELVADHIKHLVGECDTEHSPVYSEYTGYLWTDENVNIGGHDLLNELSDHKGKFLYMEISIKN